MSSKTGETVTDPPFIFSSTTYNPDSLYACNKFLTFSPDNIADVNWYLRASEQVGIVADMRGAYIDLVCILPCVFAVLYITVVGLFYLTKGCIIGLSAYRNSPIE
jgi:hypothetical protein